MKANQDLLDWCETSLITT